MKKLRNTLVLTTILLGLTFTHSSICLAIGVFNEGTITKKVWGSNPPKIRIDGVKYILMPDVKVFKTTKDNQEGNMNYVDFPLNELEKNMGVQFKALGHNVYEIQIKP